MSISAVINTFNEELNLPNVLASIKSWVDDIVVVDMHSEDRTVEIAHKFGARVFTHERLGYADPARAFAISQATHEWILMLDADEMVPKQLSQRLLTVARNDEADIVDIPWLNYFFGAPLLHSGWGPDTDFHMRFFKRGFLQSSADVHYFLHPTPSARILRLDWKVDGHVIHFNYVDIEQFIHKLNRYTSIEAKEWFTQKRKYSKLWALTSSFRGFLIRFVRHRGYRDGWRGWYLAWLWMFYRLSTFAKLEELQQAGGKDSVTRKFQEAAKSCLEDYK